MDGKGWKAAGQEPAQQNPVVDTELEHGVDGFGLSRAGPMGWAAPGEPAGYQESPLWMSLPRNRERHLSTPPAAPAFSTSSRSPNQHPARSSKSKTPLG